MRSMTGYAFSTSEGEWGRASCEIRSVNHRYSDFHVKVDDKLRFLELKIRQLVQNFCQRGRIDVIIDFTPGSQVENILSVNTRLVEQLIQAAESWRYYATMSDELNLMDIFNWPGVIEYRETNLEIIEEPVLELVRQTLEQLNSMRAEEGEQLKHYLQNHCQKLADSLGKARERKQPALDNIRYKIKYLSKETNVRLDEERLEQELVYYATKIDVSEELDRLQIHVDRISEFLEQQEAIGRRVEFLLQEAYREANTIASKSPDSEQTQHAVDMKATIDQMREQIKNVE